MTASAGQASPGRERAARVWQRRLHAELEAAARFEALAERLSEQGAGAVVRTMARQAARDELRHAELCGALVEHFGGAPQRPMPGAAGVRRVAPAGLSGRDALLYELVAFSCVTETLSTALLGALVDAARDSFAKETMHSILRDEVRHSRLGWAYLAEAHAAGARDVVAPHLERMLKTTLGDELFAGKPGHALEAELAGYGALSAAESLRLTCDCFESVIFPGLTRFGIDVSRGRRWLTARASDRAPS